MRLSRKFKYADTRLEPFSYTEREELTGNTRHVVRHADPEVDINKVPTKNIRRTKSKYFSRNERMYRSFNDQLNNTSSARRSGYLGTEEGVNDPLSMSFNPPKSYYVLIKRHLPSFIKKTLALYTQYTYHLRAAKAHGDSYTSSTAEQYGSYLQEYLDFIYKHLNRILKVPYATVMPSLRNGGEGLVEAIQRLIYILVDIYHDNSTRYTLSVIDAAKQRSMSSIEEESEVQKYEGMPVTNIIAISRSSTIDVKRSQKRLNKELLIFEKILEKSYSPEDDENRFLIKRISDLYRFIFNAYVEQDIKTFKDDIKSVLEHDIPSLEKSINPDPNVHERIIQLLEILKSDISNINQLLATKKDDAVNASLDLNRISSDLDAISSHLEESGNAKIAYALDKIADFIDTEKKTITKSAEAKPANLYVHNYLPVKTKEVPEGVTLTPEDAESLNTNNILLVEGDIGKAIAHLSKTNLRKAFDYESVMRYYETVKKYYDLNDTLYENVSVDLYLVPAGLTNLYSYLSNEMLNRKPIKPPVQVGKLITIKNVEGRQVGLFIVVSYTF